MGGIPMKKTTVLITHNFKPGHLIVLDAFADKIDVHLERARTPGEVTNALAKYPDTEILYTIHTPHTWSLQWAVRWIQTHFAGIDHMSIDVIPDEVAITTASGVNSIAVAEHAIALVLALRKQIPKTVDLQNNRMWLDIKTKWKTFAHPLLRDETIGILGYGSIGRELARIAKALGMKILAFKRDPRRTEGTGFIISGTGDPDGSIPHAYYGPDRLFEMLGACDIVVNVLPATPETRGIMNKAAFDAMKSSAIFVSIGRGKTVNEAALIETIKRGHLSGAGLDVFETEPLPPSSPLWKFENVIVSPHIGGFFSQYNDTAMILFRENMDRYLSGKTLLNRVDRKLGY
jgi:phosphoglycerate dehydrogenase-like enzyme